MKAIYLPNSSKVDTGILNMYAEKTYKGGNAVFQALKKFQEILI